MTTMINFVPLNYSVQWAHKFNPSIKERNARYVLERIAEGYRPTHQATDENVELLLQGGVEIIREGSRAVAVRVVDYTTAGNQDKQMRVVESVYPFTKLLRTPRDLIAEQYAIHVENTEPRRFERPRCVPQTEGEGLSLSMLTDKAFDAAYHAWLHEGCGNEHMFLSEELDMFKDEFTDAFDEYSIYFTHDSDSYQSYLKIQVSDTGVGGSYYGMEDNEHNPRRTARFIHGFEPWCRKYDSYYMQVFMRALCCYLHDWTESDSDDILDVFEGAMSDVQSVLRENDDYCSSEESFYYACEYTTYMPDGSLFDLADDAEVFALHRYTQTQPKRIESATTLIVINPGE